MRHATVSFCCFAASMGCVKWPWQNSDGGAAVREVNSSWDGAIIFENSGEYPAAANAVGLSPQALAFVPGESSAAARFIQEAQRTLDISIYELRSPRMQSLILATAARGVKVRLLSEPDPSGNNCDAFSTNIQTDPESGEKNGSCAISKRFLGKALTAGIEIRFFNKNSCGGVPPGASIAANQICVSHGKILIRDGKSILLMTGNLNPATLCEPPLHKDKPESCNRDYSVFRGGEEYKGLVEALGEIFELDFSVASSCDPNLGSTWPRRTGGSVAQCTQQPVVPEEHVARIRSILSRSRYGSTVEGLVTVGPLTRDSQLALIRSAKNRIRIDNQYLKDPLVNAALAEMAGRGVTVEATLADLCSFGASAVDPRIDPKGQYARYIEPLTAAGVGVRWFDVAGLRAATGRRSYMHAKAIVVDDERAWIGSANGSIFGVARNREYGFLLAEKPLVQALSQQMSQDYAQSLTSDQMVAGCLKRAQSSIGEDGAEEGT